MVEGNAWRYASTCNEYYSQRYWQTTRSLDSNHLAQQKDVKLGLCNAHVTYVLKI